jgi:hypothetical protein
VFSLCRAASAEASICHRQKNKGGAAGLMESFCGQMWNGLNSQNHGADGFLHHDRKEHQLQGNFGH